MYCNCVLIENSRFQPAVFNAKEKLENKGKIVELATKEKCSLTLQQLTVLLVNYPKSH